METLSAIRKFRVQPAAIVIALALVVSLVVCLEIAGAFTRAPVMISDPRYLVARRPLETGEPFNVLDFGLLPAARLGAAPPGDAVTDQDLDKLGGAVLSVPLASGQLLRLAGVKLPFQSTLRRSTIPPGLLAYAITPTNRIAVRAGDRLDVLLNPENVKESPLTLVEGAEVLQVETQAGDGQPAALVLALSQSDVELLEKAQQRGKLKIALRNPVDRPRRHRRSSFPGLWPGRGKKPRVQVWSEEQ